MNLRKRLAEKIARCREKLYLKGLRKRNKNIAPSIICNNCVGGVISHNLGLRFNSPTVNLFIGQKDYLAFCINLKDYLGAELIECPDVDRPYPVGMLRPSNHELPSIKIFFQHYATFKEAKKKWEDRSSRVDFNNLFFIWEVYDSLTPMEDVKTFDNLPIKKLVIAHSGHPELKNAVQVHCYENDMPVAQILNYKGRSGKRYLEEVDYVSFLNS